MRVHRLIFRLDFQKPNFEIIGSPGRVMQLLTEMGEGQYWPEFQDSTANRVISGSARDEKEGTFRQFTSEPTSMHFAFESTKGVDFKNIESDKTISTLFKGVHSLCEQFKIDQFSRAGIRFISLGNIKTKEFGALHKFESLFDKELLGAVSSTLGGVKDVGLLVDGENADKLNYHFRIGPYATNEAKKYFSEQTAQSIEQRGDVDNIISDIDFFEKNFAMTIRASQWSKEPIDKARNVLEKVKQLLANRE